MARHYVYGASLHGYLYQDGPHLADTYQEAVEALAETYQLGARRRSALKRDGYLELNLRRDGNEYCEIDSCDCADPSCHEE